MHDGMTHTFTGGRARPIMIQGTMSNAGKSLICAALCRIFAQDGYRVAPFKSQNMALNSFITNDGAEMGRAQAVQAEAAGVAPCADMNPVLLKPTTDVGSQVIVNGRSIGNMKATDYFEYKTKLIPDILAAYDRLAADNDIIVIEGAGSPAEINLKSNDIVNMGLAKLVDAPVLLVGDIDRGGVFAQLYGTVKLLDEDEAARIKGYIINKFRGDVSLLQSGLDEMTGLIDKPCIGVVPYAHVDIDDEDSQSERLSNSASGRTLRSRENYDIESDCSNNNQLDVGTDRNCQNNQFDNAEYSMDCKCNKEINIAVIRLPRMSNYSDFTALGRHEDVNLYYVSASKDLGRPDMIIIPGTKSTINDMAWMRDTGMEAAVKAFMDDGTPVMGICGGLQILGQNIIDSVGAEAESSKVHNSVSVRGMGVLDIDTTFSRNKTQRQTDTVIAGLTGIYETLNGRRVRGYEMHMGISMVNERDWSEEQSEDIPDSQETQKDLTGAISIAELGDARAASAFIQKENVLATYIHGCFDDGLDDTIIDILYELKGKERRKCVRKTYSDYRQEQYDKLADIVRDSLDTDKIYNIIGLTQN